MAVRKSSKPTVAIAYDFDGTLSPGNMQEHNFIPEIGMTKANFWAEVKRLAKKNDGDEILMYMHLMLKNAHRKDLQVKKSDFKAYGKKLKLFKGVSGWFDNINQYAELSDVKVKHYIISSGIREMIEGTSIAKYFEKIFASSFYYDHNGLACWPALVVNYTTKTQHLFRINKGINNAYDNTTINKYVKKEDRPIPFENMIFIGDGDTDIPCFRLVKEQGGHSIAVYKPKTKGAREKPEKLVKDGRVNFFAQADFTPKKQIDRIVKSIIDKAAYDYELYKLGKID